MTRSTKLIPSPGLDYPVHGVVTLSMETCVFLGRVVALWNGNMVKILECINISILR